MAVNVTWIDDSTATPAHVGEVQRLTVQLRAITQALRQATCCEDPVLGALLSVFIGRAIETGRGHTVIPALEGIIKTIPEILARLDSGGIGEPMGTA